MAKNLHLRTATKLFYIDKYRDATTLVDELFEVNCDAIDFIFAHDCELEEEIKWKDNYFNLIEQKIKELKEKNNNDKRKKEIK